MQRRIVTALIVTLAFVTHSVNAAGGASWTAWRGPLGTGEAPGAKPPVKWSETENIRWKVEVPGKGHASPIVWDDLVFLLTAVPTDKAAPKQEAAGDELPERVKQMLVDSKKVQQFKAIAYQRKDGTIRWERTLIELPPHEGTHKDGTWASASAVTDGKYLIAYFGSPGIFCLDMEGKVLWSKDLGDMKVRARFGEGSSPALTEDAVIVNWDHEGDSFIVALSKKDGSELWRKERDEVTNWSTPLVVTHGGKKQIVVNATGRVRGYDPTDGDILWECGGMTVNVVPSPVYKDGLVYAASGFRGNALLAIDLDKAKGDFTESGSAVAWRHDENTPYVPSPLLYGGSLYFLAGNRAKLSCFDAKNGEAHYSAESIEGMKGIYASPLGADGRVYICGRDGVTAVLKHGPKLEVLSVNKLDTGIDASPAAVGNELYLRGSSHLYCIAE